MAHETLRHFAHLTFALCTLAACGSRSDGDRPRALEATSARATAGARTNAPVAAVTIEAQEPAAPSANAAGASSPVRPASAQNTATPEKATPTPVAHHDEPKPERDLGTELRVKRLVVAHGVTQREPVGSTTHFAKGEAKRIYAFVEIANPEHKESEIEVRFVKDGARERDGVRLHIGGSTRWRTWATSERVRDPGHYTVVVRDGDGDVIGRTTFDITSDPGDIYPPDAPTNDAPVAPPARLSNAAASPVLTDGGAVVASKG